MNHCSQTPIFFSLLSVINLLLPLFADNSILPFLIWACRQQIPLNYSLTTSFYYWVFQSMNIVYSVVCWWMVNGRLLGVGESPDLIVFVNFPGGNTPTVVDFKIPSLNMELGRDVHGQFSWATMTWLQHTTGYLSIHLFGFPLISFNYIFSFLSTSCTYLFKFIPKFDFF